MGDLDVANVIAQIQMQRASDVASFFRAAQMIAETKDSRLPDIIHDLGSDLIATAGAALFLAALDRINKIPGEVDTTPREPTSEDVAEFLRRRTFLTVGMK